MAPHRDHQPAAPWSSTGVRAVILDTDGVVTRTAEVHREAWRELFDAFLAGRTGPDGEPPVPFSDDDYRRFVDGRSRADGIVAFLRSRGIELERGEPHDPPDRETVAGLGNRKNADFLERVRRYGVAPYGSTLALVRRLRGLAIPCAVVSASENCASVLRAAGAADLFAVRVDGVDAAALGLPGKPDPALFLEAAHRLGEDPADCTVVEDALAGVEAGRRGGFGVVIGVDRTGDEGPLLDHGADVVVPDLSWLHIGDDRRWRVAAVQARDGRTSRG